MQNIFMTYSKVNAVMGLLKHYSMQIRSTVIPIMTNNGFLHGII